MQIASKYLFLGIIFLGQGLAFSYQVSDMRDLLLKQVTREFKRYLQMENPDEARSLKPEMLLNPQVVTEMSEAELLAEIRFRRELLRDFKQELEKAVRIERRDGVFYPIPQIGRVLAGISSAAFLAKAVDALRFSGFQSLATGAEAKAIGFVERLKLAEDPMLGFFSSLAIAGFLHWMSLPKEEVVLVSPKEKMQLKKTIDGLVRELELLEASLAKTDSSNLQKEKASKQHPSHFQQGTIFETSEELSRMSHSEIIEEIKTKEKLLYELVEHLQSGTYIERINPPTFSFPNMGKWVSSFFSSVEFVNLSLASFSWLHSIKRRPLRSLYHQEAIFSFSKNFLFFVVLTMGFKCFSQPSHKTVSISPQERKMLQDSAKILANELRQLRAALEIEKRMIRK